MSVQESLSLTPQLVQSLVSQHWTRWAEDQPDLALVPEPAQLRTWLMGSQTSDEREIRNRVVRALAWWSAKDGGNDEAAATVLAWVMLPAASHIANRLSYLSPSIDDHVAAELWLVVRQPKWRTGWVASGIAGDLRKAVMADLTGPAVASDEEMERSASPIAAEDERPLDAMEKLLAILELGRAEQIITEDDRLLLLDVVVAAAGDPSQTAGYPLLGEVVTNSVGQMWGLSGRTIRRRVTAAMKALADINLLAVVA